MKENIKHLIVASSSAIPYVGGPISYLVDKCIPSELEKRKDHLIKQFDNDIEEIRKQIKPGRLESEEYMTILFKVFKSAIEEHEQEKIKIFRAILQNSAIGDNIQNPEIELYIRIVNSLSVKHIEILKLVNESIIAGLEKSDVRLLLKEFKKLEDLDDEYLDICIDELKGFKLITTDMEYLRKSAEELNKRSDKLSELEEFILYISKFEKHHTGILTNLGKRFYNYIELQTN